MQRERPLPLSGGGALVNIEAGKRYYNARAVSIQMESALVFVSDAFSTVNRIHFT